MNFALEIENLSKSFQEQKVLENISLYIKEGEKVVIFGYNGSGKTTLLRCIMGFLSFEGQIKIFGKNAKEPNYYDKRNLSYCPQVHPIWSVKVKDLINFVSVSKCIPLSNFSEMFDFFELELSSIENKKLTELSGGMRQKLFLSLALAGKPKILLLDEPFSHLDVSAQKKLFDFLKELESTQIISTHRLQDVSFATRVIYMNQGKIKFDGGYKEFLENYKIENDRII
ncbi:putative ABC transporter ATP-binding protein YxlF [bacterium HR19]|nr:putative ABC transporter ATP-binding protein YxlF [bacterium HR19]